MTCPGAHGRRPQVLVQSDRTERLICPKHGDPFAALAERVSACYRGKIDLCATAAHAAQHIEEGNAWLDMARALVHLDSANLKLQDRVHHLEQAAS